MKIHYGTILTTYYVFGAMLLGCVVFAIGCFNMYLQRLLGESEESILHSRGLNVTRGSEILYCFLPYDDCLCSVLSNKSNASENCITYDQLVGSRILPLVSFFLQIFLVRELFSLSGDHRIVAIFVLWIASILTFLGMIISIFWSSCYQAHISFTLFVTGEVWCGLSFHNMLYNAERIPSSRDNKIVPVYGSKRNDKVSRAWQEL